MDADLKTAVLNRMAVPSSPRVTMRMRRQRRRDTAPELNLRRAIRARGFGYLVHIRPLRGVSRQADIVFLGSRVAVFVDGCFWHGCPEHATWPRSNAGFWRHKIERNGKRDRETDVILRESGWTSVRVWEHEDPTSAAQRITEVVSVRRERLVAQDGKGG